MRGLLLRRACRACRRRLGQPPPAPVTAAPAASAAPASALPASALRSRAEQPPVRAELRVRGDGKVERRLSKAAGLHV